MIDLLLCRQSVEMTIIDMDYLLVQRCSIDTQIEVSDSGTKSKVGGRDKCLGGTKLPELGGQNHQQLITSP